MKMRSTSDSIHIMPFCSLPPTAHRSRLCKKAVSLRVMLPVALTQLRRLSTLLFGGCGSCNISTFRFTSSSVPALESFTRSASSRSRSSLLEYCRFSARYSQVEVERADKIFACITYRNRPMLYRASSGLESLEYSCLLRNCQDAAAAVLADQAPRAASPRSLPYAA